MTQTWRPLNILLFQRLSIPRNTLINAKVHSASTARRFDTTLTPCTCTTKRRVNGFAKLGQRKSLCQTQWSVCPRLTLDLLLHRPALQILVCLLAREQHQRRQLPPFHPEVTRGSERSPLRDLLVSGVRRVRRRTFCHFWAPTIVMVTIVKTEMTSGALFRRQGKRTIISLLWLMVPRILQLRQLL